MKAQPWLVGVTVAHTIPGRVRLAYRGWRDLPPAPHEVHHAAAALPGVTSVRVNPRTCSVVLHFQPTLTSARQLAFELGRSARPSEAPGLPDDDTAVSARTLARSFAVLCGIGVLPRALQLTISLASSWSLLAEAVADCRSHGITSRVLEGTAVSISLARGDYAVANTTNFLLALGDYIGSTTERRSDQLLRNLLRPASETAWLLRDGQEIEVPLDQLKRGDAVVVASGAIVPIDGTVLSGQASVNQAAMTGESAPVAKARRDRVLSGTLVLEGRLVVHAESVGKDALTARIADYVDQSLSTKGDAQIESNRLADRLVPSILSVAGLAFLTSGDWHRPASVLQADYSCALKLSTPIAFKYGMYGAGQSGILFKGADALERLATADTFVFDKTGTLTTGLLEVSDAIAFDASFSPEDLICLAASVEEHYSYHPLAMAVVSMAARNRVYPARTLNRRHRSGPWRGCCWG